MRILHYSFMMKSLIQGIGNILQDELLGEVSSLSMQSPDTKITWDLFKYSQQHMRNAKFRRERCALHVC